MLDRDPARSLIDIHVDAPGLAARQMLRRDISAEQAV
jgi:hypothetical protein